MTIVNVKAQKKGAGMVEAGFLKRCGSDDSMAAHSNLSPSSLIPMDQDVGHVLHHCHN